MHATIPVCPSCNSDNSIIHWGKRELKNKTVKRFFCKKCGKTFSNQLLKYTMYSPTVILSAISTYNLGYTIRQTRALINNRYKCRTTPSTIHLWLHRYKDLCTFTNKLRRRYQLDPYSLLYSKKLYHQQVYEFKYHTLKLNLAGKTFPTFRNYIRAIPRDCPHSAFLSGPRCSGLRVDIKPARTNKSNNASKLAELALTLARTPRERHDKIENFFLINDTATVAIEVPVYIYPGELNAHERKILNYELTEPLTGHIDLVQVRFNNLHILDYKPDAKLNDARAVEQLYLYAMALSKRANISLNRIYCAYFDENNYFEFGPDLNAKKQKEYK